MRMPEPGTEAFYQLGPEARTLARWRHNSTILKEKKEQSSSSLNSFIGGKA